MIATFKRNSAACPGIGAVSRRGRSDIALHRRYTHVNLGSGPHIICWGAGAKIMHMVVEPHCLGTWTLLAEFGSEGSCRGRGRYRAMVAQRV